MLDFQYFMKKYKIPSLQGKVENDNLDLIIHHKFY